MIIAMAGLPGAGKSTLAGALAEHLGAVVLNKDRVRACLFAPSHVEYSPEQDDFCVDILYRTAGWLLRRDPSTVVILDGSTYTRAHRIAGLRRLAVDLDTALALIECVCPDDLARARIEDDRATGNHPAANRDPALHRSIRARADRITAPKLVVDTTRPVPTCVAECLHYLGHEWR